MLHWMLMPYRRYAEFSGRSRRKEYWWFLVFTVAVTAVIMLGAFGLAFETLQTLAGGGMPSFEGVNPIVWVLLMVLALFGLASIIPSVAVQVRRLHDLNVSGWWYLGYAIASMLVEAWPENANLLGTVITLGWYGWMLLPGTPGPNKYGPDPKDPASVEVFA